MNGLGALNNCLLSQTFAYSAFVFSSGLTTAVMTSKSAVPKLWISFMSIMDGRYYQSSAHKSTTKFIKC